MNLVVRTMRQTQCDYFEADTSDGSTYVVTELSRDDVNPQIYCNICTAEFFANPDKACRCPICGSRDTCLLEHNKW